MTFQQKPLVLTDAQSELLRNMKPTEPTPKRKRTNRAVVEQMRRLKELKLRK